MTFEEAIESAIGTPFHWHQRVIGPHGGIDCLGLIIVGGRLANKIPQTWDYLNYGNNAGNLSQMLRTVGAPYLQEVDLPQSANGVILTLRTELDQAEVRHLAVIVGDSIIHAHQTRGVTKDPLTKWLPRADAAFKWKPQT